jgi:hypothetical protein
MQTRRHTFGRKKPMNKKLITIALSIMALFCGSTIKAQFNIGAGFAFNKYGGDYGKMHPAIQPKIGYHFREWKYFLEAGFNFSPKTGKESFDFIAYNEEGFAMEATITQKVKINNLFFHFGKSFGNPDNDFNFKYFSGISLDYITMDFETSEVPAGYIVETPESQKLKGIKIDIGIGGDLRMSESAKIYLDLEVGLPANKMNNVDIPNPTVVHWGVTAGYKLYFGGNRNY